MKTNWFKYNTPLIQSSDFETYTETTKVTLSHSNECETQLLSIDTSIDEAVKGFIVDSLEYSRFDEYNNLIEFLHNLILLNEQWLETYMLDVTMVTNRVVLDSSWSGNTITCDIAKFDNVTKYLTANFIREFFNFKRFNEIVPSKSSYLINALTTVFCNTATLTMNENELYLLFGKCSVDSKFLYKRALYALGKINMAISTLKTRLPKRIVLKVISNHQDPLVQTTSNTTCKMCKLNVLLIDNLAGCRCLKLNICASCSYTIYNYGECLFCNRPLDDNAHISLLKALNIDVEQAIKYSEVKYYLETMYHSRR